ncbi:MAG: MarR family winged helix-turn-helix transcriptional regulator [Alphaproteobacteria bacterium]|nr:MarR family winged helix-turn-helix transcriptional regulator [Alphaproteobacteria bacterium]MBU1516796.1 MarR family winged helix-turn-helix transcriptional regulator [Alphaproteobacteria bacterium]MBU2092490.1 MarR family winged helix-turn-helix transcriptional regulator [Alphaproteobacteria bacterium]MBU2152379.1 MarR family winged helix-turn-helix transcriptional regulator [Alphaproteobacteria bacterium]MBU2305590.1 MarR family winged helix-turn-helix transcriptional regulator [Alphaprot
MKPPANLLVPFLRGFEWFNTGLRAYLRDAGWSDVTTPQTMVLITVWYGANRPVEIARQLNITRQSVGQTIGEMVQSGLLVIEEDPQDRRANIVKVTPLAEQRHVDSRKAVQVLVAELERRIGSGNVTAMFTALEQEWGEPITSFAEHDEAPQRTPKPD